MREVSFGNVFEEIKINKNGDVLKIPVGDNTFKGNFIEMVESFDKMQGEVEARYKELSEGVEDDIELKKIDYSIESEYTAKVCAMIDNIFGEDTIKKCYPDAKEPNLMMVTDFLMNITPVISEIYNEREEKITNKYNRRRKGAKS